MPSVVHDLPDTLVLGAGGTLGIAWLRGILAGMEEAAGFDLRRCGSFVGTSAGAYVAASLAAGEPASDVAGDPEAVADAAAEFEAATDEHETVGRDESAAGGSGRGADTGAAGGASGSAGRAGGGSPGGAGGGSAGGAGGVRGGSAGGAGGSAGDAGGARGGSAGDAGGSAGDAGGARGGSAGGAPGAFAWLAAAGRSTAAGAAAGGTRLARTATAPLIPMAVAATGPPGAVARAAALKLTPRGGRTAIDIATRSAQLGAFDGRLRVVAVDRGRGSRVVFGAPDAPDAGVGEAVLASCAVPWIFSPVEIGGREYVDGGVWSMSNLDVAPTRRGSDVLALLPTFRRARSRGGGGAGPGGLGLLRAAAQGAGLAELQVLRSRGTRARIVAPDAASTAAMGSNLMDASRRAEVGAAAREQGRRLVGG